MSIEWNTSLQDQFAPQLICFGCGPSNPHGLQLKSYLASRLSQRDSSYYDQQNDLSATESLCSNNSDHRTAVGLIARFKPADYHCAFPGVINGGIISTLLDCHLNWTAAWHLMNRNRMAAPPCCVTAQYGVSFKAPTPAKVELQIEAWVVESSDRRALIRGAIGPLGSDDTIQQVTATGEGTFVSVKPDHPAYHRW